MSNLAKNSNSKTQSPANKMKSTKPKTTDKSEAIKPKNAENSFESASSLTPRQIVEELDRFIIGQNEAKKAVAIALRNRFRRKAVPSPLREEIMPKNILMIGPTGVGKTEIARRLASLAGAPFLKIEATKFTEVGYVGRDVDSIVRDLVEVAIKNLKSKMKKDLQKKAEKSAKKRILKSLVGENALEETQEKFSKMLENGELDEKEIEIEILESPTPANNSFDFPGGQIGMINLSDMLGKAIGVEKTKKVKLNIAEAFKTLVDEESNKMIDDDKVIKNALKTAENDGIVFIDEIDKICARSNLKGGDVSREGVQRDLLPIVEGTTVNTKYGLVKTDHILFIASGAFHIAKPSDLLPELQGRFPIRVQLKPLSEEDLLRILCEPESSLIRQYEALLAVEKIKLTFCKDGTQEIAKIAHRLNGEVENIGARRLHTLMEKILEEVSFEASEMKNETEVKIDSSYVSRHLGELAMGKTDLSKFIL